MIAGLPPDAQFYMPAPQPVQPPINNLAISGLIHNYLI
uniref:Uncharacterized protein n=1 Tax=Heterorhabditis bacteriophora TaxID=37862 RepID=A0A1I7XG50_HETBA